uniref:Uncharacterized protein n=1 Tax=Oryza sativa subsp. japonica TaxID=39947 RepID=Q33A29_ORYSJ|nr:hypothetical protein LOC_Os10g16580 [Oryza sativa Japonica Group]
MYEDSKRIVRRCPSCQRQAGITARNAVNAKDRSMSSTPLRTGQSHSATIQVAPPSAEWYVGTLFTKAGDEVLHKYTTPTATPSTPKDDRFCIQGVQTPGGGYGKGLLRPLTASGKEGAAGSRSSPPMKVKRHLTPPPIVRAADQFQEEEVKSPEPSVHKLASQVKKLHKENIELRDRNAELGVELAELRNNFDTLSRGLCA